MLRCEGGCRRPDGFPLRDAVTRLPHRAYDGRAGLVAREDGRDFGSFVPVAVRAHTHNVPLFRSMAADNNLRGVAFLFQSLDEFFGIALIQERSNLNGQLHASGPGDLYWRVGRSWISRCRGRRGGGWCGLSSQRGGLRLRARRSRRGSGSGSNRRPWSSSRCGGRSASRSVASGDGIFGCGRRRLHRGNLPSVERNEGALGSPIHACQESRGKDQDDQQ